MWFFYLLNVMIVLAASAFFLQYWRFNIPRDGMISALVIGVGLLYNIVTLMGWLNDYLGNRNRKQ